MKITDKHELLALHRCLMETKFSSDPDDHDIFGSPIVANLANKVIEELSSLDGNKWNEWRKVENHSESIGRLISAAKQINLSHIKTESSRIECIKNAISPLVATSEELDRIKNEVFGGSGI